MAGVAGLEPAHARIKTLCLTDLATPQSLKFIFLSMTAVAGLPFYQGRLYITMPESWNEAWIRSKPAPQIHLNRD